MLNITVLRTPTNTTFKLEGNLARLWVNVLEGCWNAAEVSHDHELRVDLTGVTFIDADGQRLLAQMNRHGAELVAKDCLVQAHLDDDAERTASAEPVGNTHR